MEVRAWPARRCVQLPRKIMKLQGTSLPSTTPMTRSLVLFIGPLHGSPARAWLPQPRARWFSHRVALGHCAASIPISVLFGNRGGVLSFYSFSDTPAPCSLPTRSLRMFSPLVENCWVLCTSRRTTLSLLARSPGRALHRSPRAPLLRLRLQVALGFFGSSPLLCAKVHSSGPLFRTRAKLSHIPYPLSTLSPHLCPTSRPRVASLRA